MHKLLMYVFIQFFMLSNDALASISREYEFKPRVSIIRDSSSNSLEIIAPKKAFLSIYTSARGGFTPVEIPFTVRSKTSSLVNYRLFLKNSNHYCQFYSDVAPSQNNVNGFLQGNFREMEGVQLRLDSKPFYISEKMPIYKNVSSRNHGIEILFPKQPQLHEGQICSGRISIIAEMVVL